MARALGHVVVAEGIEEPEQAAALRALGCELGQGFLFSRPVPADEAARAAAHDRGGVISPPGCISSAGKPVLNLGTIT